jgi:hypothetical protein
MIKRCGGSLFILTLLASCSARTPGPVTAARIVDSITLAVPCNRRVPRVQGATAGLSPEQQCALASAAYRAIASGVGQPNGVVPGDTLGINSTRVIWFDFRDSTNGPAMQYWSIEFLSTGSPDRTVAVHLNAKDGTLIVGRPTF